MTRCVLYFCILAQHYCIKSNKPYTYQMHVFINSETDTLKSRQFGYALCRIEKINKFKPLIYF
jgi:hypothetical protein